MKAGKIIIHVFLSLTAAFLIVGIPAAFVLEQLGFFSADVVSGASVKLPEKPSGEYIVLLNRSLHEDSLDDWTAFFRDGELNVFFDDISCIAAESDINALKMADRLCAQLPENQMRLRTENSLLLASKAENGCIDAAIFSKEMADDLKLNPGANEQIICITISGGDMEK